MLEYRKSLSLRVICLFTASVFLAPAQEVLKQRGASWDFLFFQVGEQVVDPEIVAPEGGIPDGDFDDTWYGPPGGATYDGPAFTTGENGPYGYGDLDGIFPVTNLWNPLPPGEDNVLNIPPVDETASPPVTRLHTAYFKTTVIPQQEVVALRFTGFVDDGVVIYVNGVEFGRFGVEEGRLDDWDLPAVNVPGNETMADVFLVEENISLPANTPIEIAISLHNASAQSSDMYLDVQVEAVPEIETANDNFANAQSLELLLANSENTVTVSGDTSIGGGATLEAGEPVHHGDSTIGGSLWYVYVPERDQRLFLQIDQIATGTNNLDAVLAVYTGSEVGNLTEVQRFPRLTDYPASSSRDSERFARGARVEFFAEAGESYYIAVAGSEGAVGEFTLEYGLTTQGFDPASLLLEAGAEWDYLLYTNAEGEPADPASGDPGFYAGGNRPAWTLSSYTGLPFLRGPAPLGYGSLSARRDDNNQDLPLATDIWNNRGGTSTPPSGSRYTAYFRTSFTPTKDLKAIALYGTVDDGAWIYVNGAPRASINVTADDAVEDEDERANWQLLAETDTLQSITTEAQPLTVILEGLDLKMGEPVEIAISLHNASPTSSDLALDVQIFEQFVEVDPVIGPTPDELTVAVFPTENPDVVELRWEWAEEKSNFFTLEVSPDLQTDSFEIDFDAAFDVDASGRIYSTLVNVADDGLRRRFYRVTVFTPDP